MQAIRSIRYQLPLSYAAIAFVAVLVLGLVLMGILRRYYTEQERLFLQDTAENASALVSQMITYDMTGQRLLQPLQNIARFSSTRITINDANGDLVVDTGLTRRLLVSMPLTDDAQTGEAFANGTITTTLDVTDGARMFFPPVEENTSWQQGPSPQQDMPSEPYGYNLDGLTYALPGRMPIASALYDPGTGTTTIYDYSSGTTTTTTENTLNFSAAPSFGGGFSIRDGDITVSEIETNRTDQFVSVNLRDDTGHLIGQLTVSDGPAYGDDILSSVTDAWLVAGGVAVVLAAVSGWVISRRLTAPLIALTHVTTQMARGDLSARTDIKRQDELGVLAHAYNEMAARIQTTVETLRRFVADAAHEIHTPLTALRTNLELASESSAPFAARRSLAQVARLQQLADNLLDLSRLEAQNAAAEVTPVDLSQMIREMSEIYASRAEQADIDFQLVVEDVPTINGDSAQLQRMFANLLDNAIKFTPEGGEVAVSMCDDGTHAQIEITDTGIGIPAEDLPSLFERFHRGRNTANYPGSGLGLAIVKAIVNGHKGTITATSEPGQGTTFTIRLPYP